VSEPLAVRLAHVRERIAAAAARAGRRAEEITLVGISKTRSPDEVRAALAAGLTDLGENKVQEAVVKLPALDDLRPRVRWHFVGHLQTNKAARAALLFDCIHSVDRPALVAKLVQAATQRPTPLDVLVQVDLAGESTKHGALESEIFPLLEALRAPASVRAVGLMVLPPQVDEAEAARPYFRRLCVLRDRARAEGLLEGDALSMGMSHDFEVAIEEGATLVRVGTAIFGPRGAPPSP